MVELVVGTYEQSGGCGLVPLTIGRDGTIVLGEPDASAANASFGTYSPKHGLHYFVDEQDRGAVSVLRVGPNGWRRVVRVAGGGAAPCYLTLDAEEGRLAVANYGSGSAALFELDGEGIPQKCAVFRSEGRGPVADRQEGPHAHCVRFTADGSEVFLVDLGSDRVWRIEANGSFGSAGVAWQAPPGSGPRHLLFHPHAPLAVVLSELASELTLLAVTPEGLLPRSAHSTLPHGFGGESLGGHLAFNAAGDRVYVSNRGHDSIAVFALDADDGEIRLLQHVRSGGVHPRHFVLLEDEALLVAVHERDGRVEVFALASDGRLAALEQGLMVPGACFLHRVPPIIGS